MYIYTHTDIDMRREMNTTFLSIEVLSLYSHYCT